MIWVTKSLLGWDEGHRMWWQIRNEKIEIVCEDVCCMSLRVVNVVVKLAQNMLCVPGTFQ